MDDSKIFEYPGIEVVKHLRLSLIKLKAVIRGGASAYNLRMRSQKDQIDRLDET